jgi:hypothetical protein
MSEYIRLVRGTIKAQSAYLQSLESTDMFAPGVACTEADQNDNNDKSKKPTKTRKKKGKGHPAENLQAKTLKETLAALNAMHGKLHGDMSFAKREVAWGKLDAKDMDEIFALFRGVLIPLIGISTITDIFERIAERRGWIDSPESKHDKAEAWEHCGHEDKEREKKTWNEIMKTLHEPFEVVRMTPPEILLT